MTETARNMLRSLQFIDNLGGGAMTMIAGAPGTGKTATITHYLQSASRSYLVEPVSGEGGIWIAATLIFKASDLCEPNSHNLQGDHQTIADAIVANGLLVIYKAQNLIQ